MAASSKCLLFSVILFSSLFLCLEGRDILVGSSESSWKIPSSKGESLNVWAEKNRFGIGDSLVWGVIGKNDSVLEVSRVDYLHCNTSQPIVTYKGENTTVKLDRSGPYYFISGANGHCEKGQKLIVVVMANRSTTFSPSPSPSLNEGPAAAPTSYSPNPTIFRRDFLGGFVILVSSFVFILC